MCCNVSLGLVFEPMIVSFVSGTAKRCYVMQSGTKWTHDAICKLSYLRLLWKWGNYRKSCLERVAFTVSWSCLFSQCVFPFLLRPPASSLPPPWLTKASSIKGSFDLLSIQSFNFVLLLFCYEMCSNNFQRKISLTSKDENEKKWKVGFEIFFLSLNLSFDQKKVPLNVCFFPSKNLWINLSGTLEIVFRDPISWKEAKVFPSFRFKEKVRVHWVVTLRFIVRLAKVYI